MSPPPARRDFHYGAAADRSYPTTSLVVRSRTPSPSRSNVRSPVPQYYGTANLTDRSRSPSPEIGSGGGARPPPVRRTVHTGGQRRRRRRRRRGDPVPVGQMPRVLPSPTVTPRHRPDHQRAPVDPPSPHDTVPTASTSRGSSPHLPPHRPGRLQPAASPSIY